ncbi:hypothetical protein F4778DRAFT_733100 [Xylariomycetidae sp. FL2044]|nr:hypothetical protein F4778DRAFT_733100 [Xylariomycetidae sp. FL2044]
MAPSPRKKLSLPSALLKELDSQDHAQRQGKWRKPNQQLSRKDQRKADRIQKKQARAPRPQSRPLSRTTRATRHVPPDDEDEDEDEEEDDIGMNAGIDSDEDEEEDEDEDLSESASTSGNSFGAQDDDPTHGHSRSSKLEQKQLAQDDAEISALERRLGLKGRKALPKSFDEDGLGDLLDGLTDDQADAPGPPKSKRKAEEDEWLAQKRRKAEAAAAAHQTKSHKDQPGRNADRDEEDDLNSSDMDGVELDSDVDDTASVDDNSDDFEGFSDTSAVEPPKRQRENPYVAPTTNVAKYVPPSLRKKGASDNEVEAQLRRRVQGLINRLTNDNMIGIVKDFVALYDTYPRQTVTSTLVDLVLTLVCSPEKRPDAFFAMIAGFVAAIHRAVGMAATAYFVQQLVEMLGKHHGAASGDQSDAGSRHLVSLLAELYNMQVVGCNLVFDYIRLFLGHLSQLNTELLLRIIQLCGPALRRDDPHALKDIVDRAKSTSTQGMSVKTSFMLDEMRKLQSKKGKAASLNKDLAEQRTQIRKRIGTLGGAHDAQPVRMGLQDIQNADKHGKWWLVGASWSGKAENSASENKQADGEVDTGFEEGEGQLHDEEDFLGIPDLWQLAKSQGFNTEVRQRIFVALHAATDYENADILIRKLRLNKYQRKEIPEVIVRSNERMTFYNHFYALVASRFTGNKEVWFQFRRCLTTRFRKMGEDLDTGDGDGEADWEEGSEYGLRELHNTAKLYGNLVGMGCMRLVDMVKHRNLAGLQEKSRLFMEVMFISIFQQCDTKKVKGIFGSLDSDTARVVQYFLQENVRDTELVKDKKKKKQITKRCGVADGILTSLATES